MSQKSTLLYRKNERTFAFLWIAVYCIGNSLAIPLSEVIGIDSSAALLFNLPLTAVLFLWISKNGLNTYYGLCRTVILAKHFLWYIPLVLFVSHNLWCGLAINHPTPDIVCYILCMLCVGFLEEVIFRGFLMQWK